MRREQSTAKGGSSIKATATGGVNAIRSNSKSINDMANQLERIRAGYQELYKRGQVTRQEAQRRVNRAGAIMGEYSENIKNTASMQRKLRNAGDTNQFIQEMDNIRTTRYARSTRTRGTKNRIRRWINSIPQ